MTQQIKIIILDNKFCSINTDNIDILQAIDKEFSYKVLGAEYSEAFRMRKWDGIQHLLVKKTNSNKLGIGLLDKLTTFLPTIGYDAFVEDNRYKAPNQQEIDLAPKLKEMGIVLRDYQTEIIDTAFSKKMGVIRSATGSGKSITIAALVAKINLKTIIYVIGIDLLEQFFQLLSQLFDGVGYVGNGECIIGDKVNIVSLWTAASALGLKKDIVSDDEYKNSEKAVRIENKLKIIDLLKTSQCQIFDECHAIGTSSFKAIHKEINPERIYGFSGTPYRTDGSNLYTEAVLGPKLIDISAKHLIDKNILTPPFIKFIKIPGLDTKAREYHSIYKEHVVENEYRNKLIVENTKLLKEKGYTTLVLFKQIRHGEILQELFENDGVNVELLNGSDDLKQREIVKNKVKSGETKIVLSSTIFDVGLDLPILSGLVLCSPSKSYIKTLQRIGRVLRKYPGKDKAAIIDFYDDVKYLREHSKIRQNIYIEEGFAVSK
jgi:superfamily II DNA or RNA helicase